MGKGAAWVQVDDSEPDSEAFADYWRFGPRRPRVLIDLDIWVDGEGVPEEVDVEIKRSALRAFRLCTRPGEWIYAWKTVDDYSDRLYRFWPHRATEPFRWEVSFYPDHETQLFVSQAFDWGTNASWSYPGPVWALTVFGQPLLDAFTGHWPSGWSQIGLFQRRRRRVQPRAPGW